MEKSIFECPKCEKEFERDLHYQKMIDMQNFATILSDGKQIKDMCMSCNYIEFKEKV